jgi:hypothetical protein
MAQRKHPFQNENTGEDLNPAQESEVPENSAVRTRNAPKPYPMNAPAPVPEGVSAGAGPPSDLSGKADEASADPISTAWHETDELKQINVGTGQHGKGGATGKAGV